MSSGCGCKEVYRFPHITYPYILLLYLFFFAAASLRFIHFKIYIYISRYMPFTLTCEIGLSEYVEDSSVFHLPSCSN